MTGAEVYEDLCIACQSHELRLELHAARKSQGENGHEWRALERLDVVALSTRKTIVSELIRPEAGGIYAAAALVLEQLTARAP